MGEWHPSPPKPCTPEVPDAPRGTFPRPPAPSAFLPAVGRPQQQGLAASAAVGGGVAAIDWGRHGVLLLACGEPGRAE